MKQPGTTLLALVFATAFVVLSLRWIIFQMLLMSARAEPESDSWREARRLPREFLTVPARFNSVLADTRDHENMPGGGQQCAKSLFYAQTLCPAASPTGSYPSDCATFDQLGFRVPLIAVSPFSKPHYVSHTVGSHTSLLALIEKRFLHDSHLTLRDANADTLEDLFDFDGSPSFQSDVSASLAPPPNLVTDGVGGTCLKLPPPAS